MAKLLNAHLVGVFLEDFTYHSFRIFEVAGDDEFSEIRRRELEEQDLAVRREAIDRFEQICREAGVPFSTRQDRNIAIQELLHESLFADFLVIDRKETLTRYEEEVPTRFIRELLERVQCPVLLVPSTYDPVDNVQLLYDGQPGSVYAIKTFCHVLPALRQLPAQVVTVSTEREEPHIPDSRLLKEFMYRHFPSVNYKVYQGIPETEIIQHIRAVSGHPLVVLGAYRRGMVSRWIRASMADVLMQETSVPLFIAHS
jgi:nucleotide-binding universal stress UspA family protein